MSHSVPALGYLVDSGRASFAFSGDTTSTESFWEELNRCPNLEHVVIETSFTDEEEALATLSRHLSPRLLAAELAKLAHPAPVYITHLMPGEEEAIMSEIRGHLPDRPVQALRAGMVFEL
jgi:ribonuclease BN (tRNA processing enzyme)